MPMLLDTESRTSAVTWAINDLIIEGGVPLLTMRAIAKRTGTSTSSLLHQFGNREHMLRVAAGQTARARLHDIAARTDSSGAFAFLPADEPHVMHARLWLAWCEVWRYEEHIRRSIDDAHQRQRHMLAQVLPPGTTTEQLDGTLALLDGLLAALTRPCDPMTLERAHAVLRDHLLGRGGDRARDEEAADGQEAAELASRRSSSTIASGSSAE